MPGPTDDVDDVILTTGPGATLMVIVVVSEQDPFAPTTVYVVVELGVTEMDEPLRLPGFQVYVDAPEAVRVTGFPTHVVVVLAEAVTFGGPVTVTVTVVVSEHPAVFVPMTV